MKKFRFRENGGNASSFGSKHFHQKAKQMLSFPHLKIVFFGLKTSLQFMVAKLFLHSFQSIPYSVYLLTLQCDHCVTVLQVHSHQKQPLRNLQAWDILQVRDFFFSSGHFYKFGTFLQVRDIFTSL